MLLYAKLGTSQTVLQNNSKTVNKIEMDLSAFGVESDGFPNIFAVIDFQNDTSYCNVSYYDPKFHDTTYRLTKPIIDSIRKLVTDFDLKKLKKDYTANWTDAPTSTTTFYFNNEQIKIRDYGLQGEQPLKELYRLIYMLNINHR